MVSFLEYAVHRDSRYPVYRSVLSGLDASSAASLSRTCRSFSTSLAHFIPMECDKLLRRYVKSLSRLRQVMKEQSALVVGSVPFELFTGIRWEPSTMDILVRHEGVSDLHRYLTEEEGYSSFPGDRKDYEHGSFAEVSCILSQTRRKEHRWWKAADCRIRFTGQS